MGSYSWFICWLSVLCCLSQTAYGSSSEHTSSDGFSLGDSTYETGPYNVSTKTNLQSMSCCKMIVTVPDAEGEYPVIQFQHGTCLSGADYQIVIDQIASWGFIVVAPKMYTCFLKILPPSDAIKEINDARGILSWLPTGLGPALRPWTAARPDFTRIALAGHSRGGKVVFGVALNVTNSSVSIPKFSAIVGLDPVDGMGDWPNGQLKPPVLKHKNDSLRVGVPSLVVGTGLGPTGFWAFRRPCAPQNFGHKYFYGDVAPPAFHFVVPKQGHMDFCDCSGINFCWLCPGKPSTRPQMHKFAAGIVVAFLQDALLHNSTAFDAAYEHFDQAPVALDPPESKGSIPTRGFAPTQEAPRQHASA